MFNKSSIRYFKATANPIIRYAFNQLCFRPNCSIKPESNVNLKIILFNDESIAVEYFQNTVSNSKGNFKLEGRFVYFMGNNPKGKYSCVYKLHVGKIKTFQEYEYIEGAILPDVKYACSWLNFAPNCSKKENDLIQFKTIVLNDKRIEVKDLDDAKISQKENLKSTKTFFFILLEIQKENSFASTKFPLVKLKYSKNTSIF